jgi:hypothetical protein
LPRRRAYSSANSSASLSDAQVPDHAEATNFTYAFDRGGGTGYEAESSSETASCLASSAGPRTVRGKVIDEDGDFAEYSATVNVLTVPQTIVFTTQPPDPALVLGNYEVSATGGASGNPVILSSLTPNVCSVSGGTVSFLVVGTCTIAANQAGNAEYDPAPQVTQSFNVVYGFTGFSQPVDNAPVLNAAKAGQAIPLKWRLVDANGAPVTTLAVASLTVTGLACSAGSTPDQLEEYAAGSSGLQNLGDGYYQFNWKTAKSYAPSCKTVHLDLGEGHTHQALFQFK